LVVEAKRQSEESLTSTVGAPSAAAVTIIDTPAKGSRPQIDDEPAPTRSRFWPTVIAAMIVVGGSAAMAGYLIHRNAQTEDWASGIGASGIGEAHFDAAIAPVVVADAEMLAAIAIDASVSAPMPDAPIPDPPSAPTEEIEMDPNTAEDLDPGAATAK